MSNTSSTKMPLLKSPSCDTSKKQARMLLDEKPISKEKLIKFSREQVLPPNYREIIWKILLSCAPTYIESLKFFQEQNKYRFEDCFIALKRHRLYVPIGNPNPQAQSVHVPLPSVAKPTDRAKYLQVEHFLLMWFISQSRIPQAPLQSVRNEPNMKLLAVGNVIYNFFTDCVSVMTVSFEIWKLLRVHLKAVRAAGRASKDHLCKVNENLFKHLDQLKFFDDFYIQDQCEALFCERFSIASAERIFDKIITEDFSILTFVAVAQLNYFSTSLLSAKTLPRVLKVLNSTTGDQSFSIVKSALEMYSSK